MPPQSIYSLFQHLRGRLWMPRRMQIASRRWLARRILSRHGHKWPIDEDAGSPPPGWKGWPDGKPFAFVLTHDVDTRRGLGRCRDLMDLEERLGFRSAFFFVPRGRYDVPADLLKEMVARGFEVGVHGLYHDWRTFRSRGMFEKHAPLIREYLQKWGAVGFRAPSMIRELDWIGELGVEYDASSFDTDPFEPHPESECTVFPHWVDRRGCSGYVELPYTLPQDFTLFVLLQEQGPAIWEKKLQWLAGKGGLALLDSHPDYMTTENRRCRCDEYPIAHYETFLRHARDRYAEAYWHGLPQELVRWQMRQERLPAHRKPLRVAMAAYAFYDDDTRIIRYSETLVDRGDRVDVFCLARPGQPAEETVRGVHVHRIQTRRRDEKGQTAYIRRMLRFFVVSSLALWRHHRASPFHLIHVHSVPDFEVFAAALPKFFGARLILDIHDIVPEFYSSKFKIGPRDLRFRLLVLAEKLSAAFADHVIIANHLWRERLIERSAPESKVTAMPNYVDSRTFYQRARTRTDDRFTILYPGGLQWHQGIDIAIRAFAKVESKLPKAEFHIYGEGPERERLLALTAELGLAGSVVMHEPVPLHDVPAIMANADLGIVAKRSTGFGNEAASTKIAEYMSQGLPALVPRTKIDSYYFEEGIVRFFEPGNSDDMARHILELAEQPEVRAELIRRGREYVARNGWESRSKEYMALVDGLCERK